MGMGYGKSDSSGRVTVTRLLFSRRGSLCKTRLSVWIGHFSNFWWHKHSCATQIATRRPE